MPDIKHFDPDAALETAQRLFWRQGAASTGIQDIVTATGVNRSSLYATFGGKRELYLAALRRYVEQRSEPLFRRLADDSRGLPAVAEFFTGLIRARCFGEHARWGCMVSNAHAAAGSDDPDVARVLDLHHEHLASALHAALRGARARGQLRPGTDPRAAAEVLALLAYAVNLRSRAGADPAVLQTAADAALASISAGPDAETGTASSVPREEI